MRLRKVEKYVRTKRSSSPQIVVMQPGGSGGTMVRTPFSPGPTGSAVASDSNCTS